MFFKSILTLITLALLNASVPCFGMEKAFYILRNSSHIKTQFDKTSFASLANNHQSINILISQAYHINARGKVSGFVDEDVITFTQQNNIKLLALITNAGFDNETAHAFLTNRAAQKNALESILNFCQTNRFAGVQLDFEGVSIKDKANLTRFYQQAYNLLHDNGFIVSFAIVPLVADGKQPTDFQQRKYDNWGGAYDLKTLGEYSDFITIMAYDQHTKGTTPGPTANIHWVEAAIKYTLRFIPANKVSLGVPTYSGYWYIRNRSNGHINVTMDDISYSQADKILKKVNAKLNWDNVNKINYVFYQRDWLNEYLFVENERSFKAKLDLAEKHHLRGISVFNLGNEDPKIWAVLKVNTAQKIIL